MTRNIDRLIEIMARLRAPEGGCPWDLAQTFATIAPYTVEEAYEVADAIARDDLADLKDELGDLLLQVVFHARMAEEQDAFAFDDVAEAIADKMIRRHPHVFGEAAERDVATQTVSWEAAKAAERAGKSSRGAASALAGVALALPALMRADKLQRRAARVGFDWPEARQVLDKIEEEIGELRAELDAGARPDAVEDEIGDLLFALANLARHLDIDPEAALRRGNAKFERRFRAIEAALAAEGRRPENASLEEMEELWQRAKAIERGQSPGAEDR
ncbi:MAG: nucleoside triphosphate pyrophosphohydrolase [Alphaproteobacteria bacterium]|nr:nucleoside triphosphate pyrophosphohydrolase [Alphaproteobacteria bacterium]